MTFALTAYPLSREYRDALERQFGDDLAYVNVAQLRRLPPRELWRTLRAFRGGRCLLPLEGEGSGAVVPILQAVAALASPASIEVVEPEGGGRRLSRRGAVPAVAALARASLAAQLAMRRSARELDTLLASPRLDLAPGAGRGVLYLNGNVWFGLKAGGSVGHVAGVVNALHRLGWEVELAAATEPVTVDAEVPFHRLELPQPLGVPFEANGYRFMPAMVAQAERIAEARAPSFLYQRMSLSNWAGVVLSRRVRRPLVLEYNGSEVWAARHWGRPLRFESLATRAEDACLRHAHVVVTVSQVLGDELLARGVEPERLVVYPNCVDPERFDPERFSPDERAELRASLGIPADALVVTFVGTFGSWHGAPVLAEAARRFATADPAWLREHRVRFLFVGDGVQMPEVRALVEDGPAAEFVVLTGLVPQEDAPRYLAASDVLSSPHVPNADGTPFFGSPTKLFEYMASGRAIVASDLDQIGEILRDSVRAADPPTGAPDGTELAVLTEPGSVDQLVAGLRFLVERPDWRASLGAAARLEVLARYTWRHHVEAILERVDALR